ncbi:MAG: beta-mannosidase [Lachnospiraceae bacterium]|nr:beta-mannosidase [Lachnospiraceae bacterium]
MIRFYSKNLTKVFSAALCLSVMASASGCAGGGDEKSTTPAATTASPLAQTTTASDTQETETQPQPDAQLPTRPSKPQGAMEPLVYEAEDASFTGNAHAGTDNNCSGGGYADGLNSTGDENTPADRITFSVNVPYDYYYDLTCLANSGGAKKYNYVLLDGTEICSLPCATSTYSECPVEHVYMSAGDHEIALETYWGYTKYDNLTITLGEEPDMSIYEVSSKLINPNATDNAKRLMKYLCDIYGKRMLTGQVCDYGFGGMEMQAIMNITGKRPAVLGLDMMEYTPSRVENGSSPFSVDMAIDWWEKGGIVTYCWHWNAPSKYLTGEWYGGFNTSNTNISLKKIMNGEDTEGYDLLMADIDAIAKQLQKLQDAGVPIIWRPLHEASGGWFWWGASGAEPYKALWKLLYDKLTNEYGLNNLIWLWNGQDADWYPGDEYVDIIGEDIYPGNQVDSSQAPKFFEAAAYTDTHKLVVLSENGCVPDPEKCYMDGAMWGYFCTWCGEFVLKNSKYNRYSEAYTTKEVLEKAYASPLTVTLDTLPDLKTYPLD